MTHLDLCSGIGGFTLAAGWAGFETVGFSEIDPYCCQILKRHWPQIKNYGDLRTADFSELRRRIDVLSAGVPCQPSSIAGKRRGKLDDNWLWEAVLYVVEGIEPAWCVFENPVGVMYLGEFDEILLCLEGIGYEFNLFIVPACAVGACHRRERLFIIAHTSETGLPGTEPAALLEARGWEKGGTTAKLREAHLGDLRITESAVCGTDAGISNRSHRLKALGNSVVPQQAYPFFEAIAQLYPFLEDQELRKAAE